MGDVWRVILSLSVVGREVRGDAGDVWRVIFVMSAVRRVCVVPDGVRCACSTTPGVRYARNVRANTREQFHRPARICCTALKRRRARAISVSMRSFIVSRAVQKLLDAENCGDRSMQRAKTRQAMDN